MQHSVDLILRYICGIAQDKIWPKAIQNALYGLLQDTAAIFRQKICALLQMLLILCISFLMILPTVKASKWAQNVPYWAQKVSKRAQMFPSYTVLKAFSMHETFPKLLGNISKTTWKYWGGRNFQVVLETIHGSFGNIDRPNFSR
jgi:phosphatidylglycerophosphate synthase